MQLIYSFQIGLPSFCLITNPSIYVFTFVLGSISVYMRMHLRCLFKTGERCIVFCVIANELTGFFSIPISDDKSYVN